MLLLLVEISTTTHATILTVQKGITYVIKSLFNIKFNPKL